MRSYNSDTDKGKPLYEVRSGPLGPGGIHTTIIVPAPGVSDLIAAGCPWNFLVDDDPDDDQEPPIKVVRGDIGEGAL